jgi:hypothetical protein
LTDFAFAICSAWLQFLALGARICLTLACAQVFRGEPVVEALGWAEDRKDELKCSIFPIQEEMLMKHWSSMFVLVNEAVLLLKIAIGFLCL